jgi:hypothetical protein
VIPVSDKFKEAVVIDHVMTSVIEVWPPGHFPENPGESGSLATIPIFGGSLRVDKQGTNRRRVTLKVMAEEDSESGSNYLPIDGFSELAPMSNELHIWQGVYIEDDDNWEYCKCGVFRITLLTIYDSGDSLWMQLDGLDRSWTVQQRKFVDSTTIAAGTDSAEAIQQLITPAIPWTQFDFDQARVSTGALSYDAGDDRWEAASNLATFNGMQLYYDYRGVLCLKNIPNIKTLVNPVKRYDEGEDSILLQIVRRLDGKDVYSRVVVVGRPVDGGDPFRADATDDDPDSPTFINGEFGDVPMVVKSSYVLNLNDAILAAQDIFTNGQGLTENVEAQAVADPSLQEDDVVSFKRDRANVNSDACYLVTQITLPLIANDAMYFGATRQY